MDIHSMDFMDLEDLEALEMYRRSNRRRDRVNPFDLDDEDFRYKYRFTKRFAMKIVDLLRDELAYDPRGHALTPELQVVCALRNWARHEIQDDTGDLHGVSQPVISKTCKKIAGILARMSHTYIKMPATLDEQEEVMRKFRNIANFPNVIGAIDCTHIRIKKIRADEGQLYMNRKGFPSLNVQEYEFLDLTDVKEADRSSLQCALFKPDANHNTFKIAATDSVVELSSSVNRGAVSACVTVEGGAGGETGGGGEMAPQSPARGAPPYAQPPPAYPPPHQWPVAPPNVYVSQVTANVNVHGYMGQYYQPGPQYAPAAPAPTHPAGSGSAGRPHRRDRRTKRVPSPPPPPHSHHPPHAPYYLQYPQYYPAAQAQGAPLYHMPIYQPLVYGPYPYPPYYPEYPMPVEGDGGDKPPDEYPPEVVLEQEAVDAYYGGGPYAPAYPPEAVEYMPPVYLPPPPAPAPLPHTAPMPPHAPPHQPSQPHQFNVHAKNFVAGQSKAYVPHDKPRSPPAAPVVSTAAPIDSLPIKDLKITTKGPVSPKHTDRPTETPAKAAGSPVEKIQPKPEPAKPVWTPPENKVESSPNPTKTFVPVASSGPTPTSTPTAKLPPTVVGKVTKGPAAPFSGGKQPPKPSTVPPSVVPVQQTATTPKPPFGNRQKREGPPPPAHRSPSSENVDTAPREPPLPPSKAPMPISITLPTGAGGQPLIVANKPPFSRRAAPEPAPLPQPPPPAPTASDFPPPPTPRNRGELPPPTVTPQPQPAPGKSWASLFSSKPSPATTTVAAIPTAPVPVEEPPSPTSVAPPTVASCQKPVAKVPPYDASPLAQQTPVADKSSPTPRPTPVVASTPPTQTPVPTISYSEKTSVNAVSASVPAATTTPVTKTPSPTNSEPREVPIQKDSPPQQQVQPSPFSDDPNSYRMGEFLSKYQLDNRPVSLLPRGLTNRSNYCYVNSILQALIACPPFYNMLKALPYQTRRGKSSTPVIDSMVELCYEFSPLPSPRAGRGAAGAPAVQVPAGPPLEGGAGLRVLRALRPFVGSQEGRQEDAEEFLGCLLNSLNDEMLELMKLVEPEESKDATTGQQPNGVIPQEQPPEEDDDDDEWKVMGPRNRGAVERRWAARRTPVADIFRGRTRVRLHRAPHHDVTDAVQPFFTLQLDIERATSVKDALELLAGKDTLEGVSDAWQQLSIEQLPVVLLLHLKCFQLDAEGHTAKIVKNVDFPVDLKIDPKIMSSKQKYTSKQRLYKLFAVVYHEGVEAVKGHYVTDTYHGQVGWIRYDDSTVTQVTDAQVLKPKPPRMPYLLMYRRHDTLPQHRGLKE